jgi:hypothetical protein
MEPKTPDETPSVESTQESVPESTQESTQDAGSSEPSWTGDINSLEKADWYSGLDQSIQQAIRGGIESKLKDYDSGYQKKFRTLAEERKAFEEREQALKEQQAAIEAMLYGEQGDPTVKSREEYEAKLKAETEARAALEAKFNEQRAMVEEQAAAQLVDYIEREAPEIMQDDAGFERYCKLLEAGIPADEALTMARALVRPQSQQPPSSVRAASSSSRAGASGRASEESYAAVKRRILRGE